MQEVPCSKIKSPNIHRNILFCKSSNTERICFTDEYQGIFRRDGEKKIFSPFYPFTAVLFKNDFTEFIGQMKIQFGEGDPGDPVGMGGFLAAFAEVAMPYLSGKFRIHIEIFQKEGWWEEVIEREMKQDYQHVESG